MKINVGKPDKIARIGLGVLIIALGVYFGSWWGLVGLVLLLTGFINFCPIYHLLGISTCKVCHTDGTQPK